jgi:hypothetical protein
MFLKRVNILLDFYPYGLLFLMFKVIFLGILTSLRYRRPILYIFR